MKKVGLTMSLLLSASMAMAAGSKHECSGTVIDYENNRTEKVSVQIDTQLMQIRVVTEDGQQSQLQITESSRSRSYMRGVQLIQAKNTTGDLFTRATLHMPWTNYYSDQPRLFLYTSEASGPAMLNLNCDSNLYDGPELYVLK